jgi:hypothetical protein
MPSALNFRIANPGGTSAPSTPHDPARAAFEQDQEERVGLVGKGKGKEPAREFAGRGVYLCVLLLVHWVVSVFRTRFCFSSLVPLVCFISAIHFLFLFHLYVLLLFSFTLSVFYPPFLCFTIPPSLLPSPFSVDLLVLMFEWLSSSP